jgi:hypothetical protein
MARRFCCWVIVSGGQPTAFRSREPESLLPTLRQLQRTQPDSTLKWFDRGRLWDSPAEATAALGRKRRSPSGRGRDWRPGGSHVDPRAQYRLTRDQKRARFKRRLRVAKPPAAKPSRPRRSTRPPKRSR